MAPRDGATLMNAICGEVLTAWAVTAGGLEEIERFADLEEAVAYCLDLWPEDDHDVRIGDDLGRELAYLARGTDPAECLVLFPDGDREKYRCEYVPGDHGRVVTVIERLA